MKIKKLSMQAAVAMGSALIVLAHVLILALEHAMAAADHVMDVLVTAMVVVLALAKQPVKMIVLALVMVAVCNHV